MDFKWINHQEVFPGVNVSLIKDIMELSSGQKIIAMKWAKQFNLEYVGELAVRWTDRNIVQDIRDLRALILGISFCGNHNFLYDQRKRFVHNVSEYLAERWDVVAAAAILKFGITMLEDVQELQAVRKRLIESDCSYEFESDRILLIGLLTDAYIIFKDDELRTFILRQVDGLTLKIVDSHREYPLLLLLSKVYSCLKPNAKELQTKGMSRLLQVIGALRTKEVGAGQDYHNILNVSLEDMYALNYLLAIENTPQKHTITGPGLERIKENYYESYFLSEEDIPAEVDKRIVNMGTEFFVFLLHRITRNDGSIRFRNTKNLQRMILLNEEFLLGNINSSYLLLLEKELLFGDMRKQVIQNLLQFCNLKKEQFEFLETLRLQENVELSPSKTYTMKCLEYGYASLDNVIDLEQRGMVSHVIEILKKNESFDQLITILEQVPISYHKFLLKEHSFNKLMDLMEDDLKKRLYSIYLNALYAFEVSKYPGVVFEMINNEEFKTLFNLSEADLRLIEEQLYMNKLLPDSTARSIKMKYMTAEQLDEMKIIELGEELEKLKGCYSLQSFAKKNLNTLMENSKLRNAFINQMLRTSTLDEHSVKQFLLLYYQMRARGIFTLEDIERIESKVIQAVSTIKIA